MNGDDLITGSSYTDSGLTNGTTYRYALVAVDGSNNRSLSSGELTATPAARRPRPDRRRRHRQMHQLRRRGDCRPRRGGAERRRLHTRRQRVRERTRLRVHKLLRPRPGAGPQSRRGHGRRSATTTTATAPTTATATSTTSTAPATSAGRRRPRQGLLQLRRRPVLARRRAEQRVLLLHIRVRRVGGGAVAAHRPRRECLEERHRDVAPAALELRRQPPRSHHHAAALAERSTTTASNCSLVGPRPPLRAVRAARRKRPDSTHAHGVREIIVGTGGAEFTSVGTAVANSEVRNATTFGVLKLRLHQSSYDWQFLPPQAAPSPTRGRTRRTAARP